ncbi:MAG: DEAD-box ATP-dependent helicase CshA, partial [Myxococcaceae bacterium]|nr:DEAD-box ATP-dependent helicase CshA [Myxococcaceae bacterium]
HPTPVQLSVYEPACRGKNLVVQARTGTGKTAAFGLPIIDKLVRGGLPKVQALILTPTRELALQVSRELVQLAQFRGTKVMAIYGGAPMGKQIDELAAGAQIVVGTPGRVLDHLRRGTLDPSNIRIFVLDEADEMLSMGFAKELHSIVETLPKERQGLFFSATIPPDIERMAISQLKDPEFVTLSSDQIGALSIDHFIYMRGLGDKRKDLVRILEVENPESAIVFCNTKDETERVAEALQNKGYAADWLNGDLEQSQRERVMAATREGKVRFLVCTDVAARGIDISHLTHVINADFPESAEQYVHRTGRTGRAGKTGMAISLVGPKDIGNLYILRLTYKIRPIEKQLPNAADIKTRSEHDLVATFAEAFGKSVPHPDDLALTRRLLTHVDSEQIIAGLLRTYLGARESAGENPAQAAAEMRRAKNPPPFREPPPERVRAVEPRSSEGRADAPAPRRERAPRERGERDRGERVGRPAPPPLPNVSTGPAPSYGSTARADAPTGGRRRGMPHTTYSTWEPTAEKDDDQPILAAGASAPAPTAPTASAAQGRASRGADASEQGGAPSTDDEAGLAQIFINIGKRDGTKPSDIQQLLDAGGVGPVETGRIRIRDRITFVSVKKELVEKAVAALAGQVVGGRSIVAELARASDTRERTRSGVEPTG